MHMVKECKRFNGSILFLVFSLVIFFSCHSSKKMNANKNTTKNMLSEIWNPLIVLTKKENKIVKVKSEKLYKEHDDSALLVGDVEVDFFDEEGNRISVLYADTARINEKTNDLNAHGNVFVVSDSGYTLSTNKLSWNNGYEMIMSEDSVTFTTLEGDTLHGVGFESDSDLEEWRIYKPFGIARKGM